MIDIESLVELDNIYTRYGYELKANSKNVRVYIFTKSIYSGVDIIRQNNDDDVEILRKEYSAEGYAVKIRDYKSAEEAQIELFKDFFKADGVLLSLKRRYNQFVERLMDKLPDNAEYEYVKSPYEYQFYTGKGYFETPNLFNDNQYNNLTKKIVSLIDEYEGPLFIVLEAAAGYGKTCTAYEVLNEFLKVSHNKIPFFTELSRDRKATIFKHILHNEIEEQFANRVDSKVVIQEIKDGRIPLIIDGFDELISKDFSFSSSEFKQVESMLSTIVDLLSGNAKIIVTSRKTAIFNSEDFLNWMDDRGVDYSMVRISISEPQIEDWLSRDKINFIEESNFPIDQISNPVLLTYLKHVGLEELKEMVVRDNSIVDKYFHFLLEREQTRQDLLIEPDTQLRIFRKLARLMSEYDIKTASKEDMKDLLISYNRKILDDALTRYTPDKRPRLDQLAGTLSNHAFLDRKDNKSIGFINEFVLGTLIGQSLIMGKFAEHKPNYNEDFSQMFAMLAVQAFEVQSQSNKKALWRVFNDSEFFFDQQFFFKIDTEYNGKTARNYRHAAFQDFEVNNINFDEEGQFSETIFTNCSFYSCHFKLNAFEKCSLVNCKFFDCSFDKGNIDNNYEDYFTVYGCESNNDFIEIFYTGDSVESIGCEINYEKLVLDLFFKQGNLRPRLRQLSHVKAELKDYKAKDIAKHLHKLKVDGILQLNGDLGNLTRAGISYYNEKYRN